MSYQFKSDRYKSNNLKKVKNLHGDRSTFQDVNMDPGALEHNPEIEIDMLNFLNQQIYPYRYRDIPFEGKIFYQLRKFMIALDAYLESSNPVQTAHEIIHYAVSKNGASQLKKIRMKSFLKSVGASYTEEPEGYENIPFYIIKDIGDIFYYKYSIHFVDDTVDDLKYGFIDYKINESYIKKFRRETKKLLQSLDDIEEIDPFELQMLNSSSTSKVNDKHLPHWTLNPKEKIKFSRSIGLVDRSIIQVSPDNARDSVILSAPSLNRVRWIDRQTQLVIEQIEECWMNLSNSDIKSKIYKTFYDYPHILCRDLRKEGITKPRELVRILLEELKIRYPNAKAYEFPDFYDDYSIKDINKEIIYPKRGHGLGMANALTSLMQAVVSRLIERSMKFSIDDFRSRNYNDDYIVGFKNLDDLEEYWDKEGEILEKLGLIRVPTKSFEAHDAGVLCEEYFSEKISTINNKESIRRYEILRCLLAHNIVEAKEMVQSIQDNGFLDDYIEEIISFWGYEFFPGEESLPAKFGGWLSYKILGVNLDFKIIEDHFNNNVIRSYNACKADLSLREKMRSSYQSQIYHIYENIHILEEDKNFFNDVSGRVMYNRLLSNKVQTREVQMYYSKLFKKRKRIYNTHVPSIPLEEFTSIVRNHYDEDFYPLSFEIERFVNSEVLEEFEDYYFTSNPFISAIGKGNPNFPFDNSIIRENFSIRRKDQGNFIPSKILDKEEIIYLKSKNLVLINEIDKKYSSSDEGFLESFINPEAFATVSVAFASEYKIPVLKHNFRADIIKKKKEIYGKILSPSDYSILKRFKIPKGKRYKVLRLLKLFENEEEVDYSIEYLNNLRARKEQTEEVQIEKSKETSSKKDYSYLVDMNRADAFFEWQALGRPEFDNSLYPLFQEAEMQFDMEIINSTLDLLQESRSLVNNYEVDIGDIIVHNLVKELLLRRSSNNFFDSVESGSEEEYGLDFF
jgi:hypothetical protein